MSNIVYSEESTSYKIYLRKYSHLPKIGELQKKASSMTFREAARTIYETEGSRGFLRGLAPSLLKNSVMTGQYFSILFYIEVLLRKLAILGSDAQVQSLSGALAKSMQSVLANPLIVIKTRLEVVGFNEYSGIHDACRQIYAKEGMSGFFTGLKISLIRDVPFSGLFYPVYSFFRQYLTTFYDNRRAGKI